MKNYFFLFISVVLFCNCTNSQMQPSSNTINLNTNETEVKIDPSKEFKKNKNEIQKKEISYGSDPLQKMDVYIPKNYSNSHVIFMVHGGGWRNGDKAHSSVIKNKKDHWVKNGFIFISVNYRLLPEASVMTQLHDVANALVEAQRQAPFWGGDASKFILMGHSAGGHLISFIASDANFALRKGAMPWLGSIILDSGALNVPSLMSEFHFSLFDDAFGNDSKYWIKISPIHQLKTQTAPILLVSSARRGVSVNQAEEYYKKTINLGTKAMHLSLNLSHREINVNLGLDNDYTKNVDEFIKSMQ